MTDLNETLAAIVEKIKKYRSLYEENEMAVSDQIVTPVLMSLGWSHENPEEVYPNISTEDGVPDYSLIKNGKKVLFIKAKKLEVDVEQKDIVRQLSEYCLGEVAKYGILTNGVMWILFRYFEKGTTIIKRVVWKADLEHEELQAVLRKLQTISKDSIEHLEMAVKKVQVLDDIWTSLLDEPEDLIRGIMPTVKTFIGGSDPCYKFNDAEIEDFLMERFRDMACSIAETHIVPEVEIGGTLSKEEKPKRMKISNEVFEIRSANEILINTANWLMKKGSLKISDYPVPAGPKRYIINKEPKHRYGDSFRTCKKLSNGLWLCTNYNAAGCINSSRRLLERFGYSPDTLVIEC